MMWRAFGHVQPAVYLQHLPYLNSSAIAVQSFTVTPEAVSAPRICGHATLIQCHGVTPVHLATGPRRRSRGQTLAQIFQHRRILTLHPNTDTIGHEGKSGDGIAGPNRLGKRGRQRPIFQRSYRIFIVGSPSITQVWRTSGSVVAALALTAMSPSVIGGPVKSSR